MKKLISVLLVVLLLFALCSCGKESSENSMETNETTQITEDKTTENDKIDDIDDKQENNTETTTENTQNQEGISDETTKSENNVGNKKENFDKNPTTFAPENTDSGNKKPNDNNDNTVQSNTNQENKTEEEKVPSKGEVYFEKFEYVSRTFAYPYYIDGKNLVNRLYGDKCMQTNDTVTYRIVMSDGGTSGFKIIEKIGASISVDGNLVTISANGTDTEAGFIMKTNDKNGNTITKTLVYNVIQQAYCIVEDEVSMYVHLRDYAMSKGLKYYNGNELTGYTANNETLSITNYNKKGTDDYVPIKAEIVNGKYVFGNADWVKKALWVIDKYAEMGLKKWGFQIVYLDGFATIAE